MRERIATIVAIALLVFMVTLLAKPIREESATMDEPVFLAAGYSYCRGFGFYFDPEAPPLAKMISGSPLLLMDVRLPPAAQSLLNRQVGFAYACPWSGWAASRPVGELFPSGRDNWYYWPFWEAQLLAETVLYGSGNDADKLLAAGRWTQVALTVLTGVVIFFWLRRLAGVEAAALGVALWALNPLALAYGHLVLSDMGVTLMITLTVWRFACLLDRPSVCRAVLCGLAFGGALVMKFSAIVLTPILFVLGILHVITRKEWRGFRRHVFVIALAAMGVVLVVYAPFWGPAPSLPAEQAAKIGVPAWFQVLRPVLIPPDFFKGLALVGAHAASGHEAFLCGQWRQTGWWYYFPVALAVKTPIPLLLLMFTGLTFLVARWRQFSLGNATPWLAALIYLAISLKSTIDIGVRHLLPIFPLMAVGIASQMALQPRWVRLVGWLCAGWLLLATWRAHPFFLEYFNEAAGGSANGYRWLVDSNLDWGQDVKRLKRFLNERGIASVDLSYFGQPYAVGYCGISSRRVTADQARKIRDGTLVVSASLLVRPEWDWLRNGHTPAARVGYTLFVYSIGSGDGALGGQ